MGELASLFPTASELVGAFFRTLEHWMATGTTWVLSETWRALSATTEPVLTGTAFDSEYHVMALIGLGTVLPLLGLAVIQAIAHQDVSGLLRTALLRLPMAILLTGVVIEIVSLGLTATDRASSSLLSAGGAPAASLFTHLEAALTVIGGSQAEAFGGLLLVAVVAIISFILWIELAVRSAAVAVAAMFLPLALAGLVWPATSHWARRLGETLAALVLMKLVMAAVLALAAGALAAGSGGIASVVEGLALLGLSACSPFALFRLVPMVEAGAVSHLEGARPASTLKQEAWSMASSGAHGLLAGLAGAGGGVAASGAGAASAGMSLPAMVASSGTSGGGEAGGATGAAPRTGGGGGGGGAGAGTGAGSRGADKAGAGSGSVNGAGAATSSASAGATGGPNGAGATASGNDAATGGPNGAGATASGNDAATASANAPGGAAGAASTSGLSAEPAGPAADTLEGHGGAGKWARAMAERQARLSAGGGDGGN
jgi:hypothetical protein